MNEQIQRICELPVTHRVAILVGSVGLVVLLYWLYFYGDLSEGVLKLEKEIEGKEGLKIQIAQQEGIAQNLEQFREEVRRLDIELDTALSELPDKKEIAGLLSKISDKARDAGLDIKSFKPSGSRKKDFYAEVPVNIQVTGTYHQVATFFDEVGRLDRIVNIGNFDIAEPVVGDERIILKTNVTATAFRFLDEKERNPQDNKGRKKRRKKK